MRRQTWLWRTLWVLVALIALTYVAWQLSRSRSMQLFGELVTHGSRADSVVALTFDDGPTPFGTEPMVEMLDSLEVTATFFVTGRELAAHPELGVRLVQAGHTLANHSYSHAQMVLKPLGFMRREVEVTDSLIRRTGYEDEIYFRPPYGKRLLVLPWYLKQTNRTSILWDVEPESYPEVRDSAEAIAAHVLDHVQPGSIILLHVMYRVRQASVDAVPLIVSGLRARGYRIVDLPELVE
ncbi:MAG: polysaccharide deacetylase family protein [Bacteroidota bacterium]